MALLVGAALFAVAIAAGLVALLWATGLLKGGP